MRRWIFYSAGSLGWSLVNFALLTTYMFRYDPASAGGAARSVLVPLKLIGTAMFFGRLVDAVSDPLVGNWSDRVKGRWGRRRPFMAAGLPLLVISFVLLYTPPAPAGSQWNFVWLCSLLVIYFLAFTFYVGPYLALLPEIAGTSVDRVRLSSMMAMFVMGGTGLAGVAAPWLADQFGYLAMALCVGAVGAAAMLLPLTIQEDLTLPRPADANLWHSVCTVWANPPFRPYILTQILMMTSQTILMMCAQYFAVALLARSEGFASVVLGVALTSAVIGLGPLNVLTTRVGKKRALQIAMVWLGVGLLALLALPLWTGRAVIPWLTLLAILSMPLAAVFALPNAILADVIDADAARGGSRREAIHFGVQALGTKMSAGVAAMISGRLLTLGKTADDPLGVNLVLLTAGLFPLLAAWAFRYYPIEK